jgi:hypothetical protein
MKPVSQRFAFRCVLALLIAVGAGPASPLACAQGTPQVQLSKTSLAFGSVQSGRTTVPQLITLTNIGTATLNISSIITGDPDTFLTFKSCPDSLAAGTSCDFSVSFSPMDPGPQTSKITISDNAPDSPQIVNLSGTSLSPAVGLTPLTLDFGVVANGTTSSPETVTVTNQSGKTLSSIGITASGGYNVVNNCPASLPTGGTCSFSVTFSPTSGGPVTGDVTITDSDISSPQLVGLSGTGSSGAVSLNPPQLTFPATKVGGTSMAQSFAITNSGGAALSLISVSASGDFNQNNTCPTSLAPGASCTVKVSFQPSAAGRRTGYVTISDTDATNLQTENLRGTGSVPASTVTVSPKQASLTFTQTQQFQAFINGLPTNNITWSVDGVVGGNAQVGTISTSGLYTPPKKAGSHSVVATDISDPTQTATAPAIVSSVKGVYTYHYDNQRTGQNTNETVLTTGNVSSTQFGKLFSYPVDGELYTDPLYVAGVKIPGQGTHNVVYVTTEADSVYAFDADGLQTTPLWHINFTNPSQGITTIPYKEISPCNMLGPVVGITSTPVIDPASQTLYVVVRTKEVSGGVTSYPQRLHALNITSGAEVSGSPVRISASVAGHGVGDDGQGMVAFDDLTDNSRAGLLELNGVIYITWSSLCDQQPYHGWVIGYDAKTLQQTFVLNTSPNGTAASIWAGGAGIPADADGNIYIQTSNGDFNADGGGDSYGDTMMKIGTSSGNPQVLDYFTPYNQAMLAIQDFDLASGGPLLLPDQPTSPTHLLVGAGKEGSVYVVDRDNMGHFRATDNNQTHQWLPFAVGTAGDHEAFFGMPAYWQNHVYFWGANDFLKDFRLFNSLLSPTAIALGSTMSQTFGPTPSVSSNGTRQGIVWTANYAGSKRAVLRAYDAANISRELYNSTQAGTRDQAGLSVEFTVPTVVNGKVYLGTQTELDVYGLLP